MIKTKYTLFLICVANLFFAQLPYTSNGLCFDKLYQISGYNVAQGYKNMVVRDFNGDSFQDIAIVDSVKSSALTKSLTIFCNQYQNSTVNPFQNISYKEIMNGCVINGFNSFDAGNLNNDGKPDLVIPECSHLSIKVNTTNNSSQLCTVLPSFITTTLAYPTSNYTGSFKFVKCADLNNDSLSDIILITDSFPSNDLRLLIYRNITTSSVNFAPPIEYYIAGNILPLSNYGNIEIYSPEVNGDPYKDIVINYEGTNIQKYLVNNTTVNGGNISFSTFTYNPLGSSASNISDFEIKKSAIARVDLDQSFDMVTHLAPLSASVTNHIFSFWPKASINLNPVQTFSVSQSIAQNIYDLKLLDVNEDSYKDLVLLGSNATAVKQLLIYYFDSNTQMFSSNLPTFIQLNLNTINAKPTELNLIDYNKDNRPDLAIKNWKIGSTLYSDSIFIIPNFNTGFNIVPNFTTICNGYNFVFTPNVTNTIGVNYVWSLGSSSGSVLSTSLNYTATKTSTNVFNPNIVMELTNTKCNYNFINANLKVNSNATITILTTNSIVCRGDSVSLKINTIDAQSYTLQPNGIINQSNVFSIINNNTTFTAIATATNGCISSDSVKVNVFPKQSAQIIIPTNTVCLKDSILLKSANVANDYSWSNGEFNSNFYFKPLQTGNHLFILDTKDLNNCKTLSDTVEITVLDCKTDSTIKTYNLITPNNDGINDVLFIENIKNHPNAEVTVFTRWGDQIFSTKGYDNTNVVWPLKNQSITSSTYFYVITENKLILNKGWIEILKN
jgi:gliding motility-associated-like protein